MASLTWESLNLFLEKDLIRIILNCLLSKLNNVKQTILAKPFKSTDKNWYIQPELDLAKEVNNLLWNKPINMEK